MSGSERRQGAVKGILERYIEDARRRRLWVYRIRDKKWFTPDEFEVEAISIAIRDPRADDALNGYKMGDPWVGVKVRVDYAKKINDEVKSFTDKVYNYYNPTR